MNPSRRSKEGPARLPRTLAREAVAVGELRVRALGPTVRGLHRREEFSLEPVRVVLVELLVRRSERRQPKADLINRGCERVEQLLPCLCARVRHIAETTSRLARVDAPVGQPQLRRARQSLDSGLLAQSGAAVDDWNDRRKLDRAAAARVPAGGSLAVRDQTALNVGRPAAVEAAVRAAEQVHPRHAGVFAVARRPPAAPVGAGTSQLVYAYTHLGGPRAGFDRAGASASHEQHERRSRPILSRAAGCSPWPATTASCTRSSGAARTPSRSPSSATRRPSAPSAGTCSARVRRPRTLCSRRSPPLRRDPDREIKLLHAGRSRAEVRREPLCNREWGERVAAQLRCQARLEAASDQADAYTSDSSTSGTRWSGSTPLRRSAVACRWHTVPCADAVNGSFRNDRRCFPRA
jgi:hypothetical protein